MDQNIYFTMIQQIFIFFQVLGYKIIYFTFAVTCFNYIFKAIIYFNSCQPQNYLLYHLPALNYLFKKYFSPGD